MVIETVRRVKTSRLINVSPVIIHVPQSFSSVTLVDALTKTSSVTEVNFKIILFAFLISIKYLKK